ncbi:hypothetical protein B7P43_G10545, partial [Cryptotermes secundus]
VFSGVVLSMSQVYGISHAPTATLMYLAVLIYSPVMAAFAVLGATLGTLTEDKIEDIKDRFYEELEHVFEKFPKYTMKILQGDLNAKVGKEDFFKPTIGNESLHEINNDNGVRVVNFATSKILTVKSTMFLHRNIHKFTWTSPNGKIHSQIEHIFIDRRLHSFRAGDGETDHYLVVAKVRERLAVSKQKRTDRNVHS